MSRGRLRVVRLATLDQLAYSTGSFDAADAELQTQTNPEPRETAEAAATEFSLSGRDIIARLGQSGFSSIASRLRGVIAMPMALLVIGTKGYGTLTASFALGSILGTFATLGMPDAVGRLIVSCKEPGVAMRMVHAVRTTGTRTLAVLLVAACACLVLGAGPVLLWGTLIGISTAMFKLGAVHLEYFQRTAKLLRLSLLNNYGSLALAVIGGLAFGFTGFMAGNVIGTAIAAFAAWTTLKVTPADRRRRLPARFWPSATRLTLLLLPVVLSQWAMVSLGSLIIYGKLGAEQAGAYSTAYSLSSISLIMVGAISGVWAATAQRLILRDPARTVRVGVRIVAAAAALGLLATVAAIIAVPFASDAIGNGSLAGAPECVPWLIGAFTLLAIAQVPSGLIYVMDQTRFVTICTIASSVVSVGLLWAWIPDRGIEGGAQATLVGYGVLVASLSLCCAWLVRGRVRADGQSPGQA